MLDESASREDLIVAIQRGEMLPASAVVRYAQIMCQEAVAAERERCAVAVEMVGEWVTSGPLGSAVARPSTYRDYAAVIRARKT
jgi:hypothetical protein